MSDKLDGVLILELFPGAGLFGRAFESLGATVVRAPDTLWGGDIREFFGIPGRFDGVIGSPPCQAFSIASAGKSKQANLIPEFLRIVDECKPIWAVMENVIGAKHYAPAWDSITLRDWDCGGNTHRLRAFWFYGVSAPLKPSRRPGQPELSVLASNWKQRGNKRKSYRESINPDDAANLQGFPSLDQKIMDMQPGGISQTGRKCLAIHMLGNGVPRAMGSYVANHIAQQQLN